jgi:hypothetical protein
MRHLRSWTTLALALSLALFLGRDHAEAEGEIARIANVSCAQFYDRMVTYMNDITMHEQSFSQYLGQYSDQLNKQYSELSQLEGQLRTLPPGTFEGLKNLADQSSPINQIAIENTQYVTDELNKLLSSFISQRCSIDP